MTDNFPAGVNLIFNKLQAGEELGSLKAKYDKALVNRALAGLEIFAPDFIDQTIGTPASNQDILMDQCVGFSLTETIHQHIGRPHALQFVMRSSTKDPEVYDFAREAGYTAIVTADGAQETLDDLCAYAKSVSDGSDESALPADCPIIFVVSNDDRSIEQIQENTARINEALRTRENLIVDLRM